ncbi:hypothetical protein GALMADRAFT_207910 [Galerina marginata CBS 339.88]|uniref:F-box domain-containing protein n=1 Tax=Galerina marginata (strain CBS 339.88) TaxID=685588 RepID=A0A067TPY4_GALM3|nr:hypothetical protein GALMADRAFT_207910 [Galerina marginata CBS 339.88]
MDPEKQFLPQELLDNFVDEIGREYIASFANGYGNEICQTALISFLSVSRSFHDRAIGALFRQVHLTDRPERDINHIIERISGLRQIMHPTPGSTLRNVAPCIQTFTLNLKAMRNVQRFRNPIGEDAGHTWLVNTLSNKETTGLFDDLHQNDFGIREFTLRLTTTRNVIWTELPPHFSSSVLSLIRSPHLRTLYFAKISLIPPTLLNGSHIRDLRLEQLAMVQSNNHNPTEHPSNDADGHNLPCPKLDVLQTDSDFPVDLDPTTSPLTDLKKFKASCVLPPHYSSTQKILLLAQNTLEDIRLDFSGERGPSSYIDIYLLLTSFNFFPMVADILIPAGSIDFGCMPRLRTLTLFHFRLFDTPYWQMNDPGMAHICRMLDAYSPLKSLTEINLEFHFNEVGVQENFLHPQPNNHWHDIDGILTSAKYPALRKVGVLVNSDIIMSDHAAVFSKKRHVQDTRRLLFEAFARLSASEKIDLTVDVDTSVLHQGGLDLRVDDA